MNQSPRRTAWIRPGVLAALIAVAPSSLRSDVGAPVPAPEIGSIATMYPPLSDPSMYSHLNLPNGCVIEAVHFQQIYLREHPQERAALLITPAFRQLGDHAFVAYSNGGRLWTYCALFGHQETKLRSTAFASPAAILRTYHRMVRHQLRKGRRLAEDPSADSGEPTTSALHVLRAAEALEAVRVKCGIIGIVDVQGRTTYVLVYAWRNGAAVYTPDTGTVLTDSSVFGVTEITWFTQTYLNVTPAAIRNESLSSVRAAASGPTFARR